MQDNKIKQEIEDVELIIGKIMQIGVLIAGAVLIVGVVACSCKGMAVMPPALIRVDRWPSWPGWRRSSLTPS